MAVKKKVSIKITPTGARPAKQAGAKKSAKIEARPAIIADVQKSGEPKLIDMKVLRGGLKHDHFPKIMAYTALGFLVVALAFWFYFYYRNQFDANYRPEIIVPTQNSQSQSDMTPTQNTGTAAAPETPAAVITPKIIVQDTPSGILNVRKGPGVNFDRVAKIKPGEIYDLLEEDKQAGWYKIKVSDTLTGWVTGLYVKVQN
ncbi:SH3 domain-containing protein [bacterium]|nr:MAG: SH3 domain-containing protein [bacterium]